MNRPLLWLSLSLATISGLPTLSAQTSGVRGRRPLPDEYGRVVMNALSEKNQIAPVVFDHWRHRLKYTCRLCHVDIGFAMEANGTRVREEDNRKGFYCGACHNGKLAFGWVAEPAVGDTSRNCDRCHSQGKTVPREMDFAKATGELPRGRFGNGVDWEQAEVQGKLKLIDTLPHVSVQRKPLQIPADYNIEAKITTLPEIVFSHQKHAVWNGCELCHPDVFTVKRGSTRYTMEDIFARRYCGLCHGTVAFPTTDCQRCHTRPVRPS